MADHKAETIDINGCATEVRRGGGRPETKANGILSPGQVLSGPARSSLPFEWGRHGVLSEETRL